MTDVALCRLGDQYALKMRLVDHVYDDQVIDSLTVKIILPEGARSVLQAKTPREVLVTAARQLNVSFMCHQKHQHGHALQN